MSLRTEKKFTIHIHEDKLRDILLRDKEIREELSFSKGDDIFLGINEVECLHGHAEPDFEIFAINDKVKSSSD